MRFRITSFVIAALAALFIALPVLAADKGDVAVELTGRKVVKEANGKETFESAAAAKPGDVIEYRAVYRNNAKKTVTNLLGVIPVPNGTEYIPGSSSPSRIAASLDGKTYAPAPLKRKVKLPSGAEELQDVPVAEYRSIRWELKDLGPGQSVTVSMRVKISKSSTP